MKPELWGSEAWHFLHMVTFTYPSVPTLNEKLQYYKFFLSLQHILPCKNCRINYKKHLNKYPLSKYLGSRKLLIKWLINVHNEINKKNGKK